MPLHEMQGSTSQLRAADITAEPVLDYHVVSQEGLLAVNVATIHGRRYYIDSYEGFFAIVNASRKPKVYDTMAGVYEIGFGYAKFKGRLLYEHFLPIAAESERKPNHALAGDNCARSVVWYTRVADFYQFELTYRCPHWGGSYSSVGYHAESSKSVQDLFDAASFVAALLRAGENPDELPTDAAVATWAEFEQKQQSFNDWMHQNHNLGPATDLIGAFQLKSYDGEKNLLCATIRSIYGLLYNGYPHYGDAIQVCAKPSVDFAAALQALGPSTPGQFVFAVD